MVWLFLNLSHRLLSRWFLCNFFQRAGRVFAALTSGAIDGAMLSGDKKVQAEKIGFHVTIDLNQLPIYYPVNGVVASKKFVGSNPYIAKNFLKSWLEGI